MPIKILVVEDDYLQSEWLLEKLKERFPEYEIELCPTESDFYRYHAEILVGKHKPDIVLMDVMLKWTDATAEMPPPPEEVITVGYFEAGLRCRILMRNHPMTKDIPVILYTQLERTDLKEVESGDEYIHLRKDSNVVPLFETIAAFLDRRRSGD